MHTKTRERLTITYASIRDHLPRTSSHLSTQPRRKSVTAAEGVNHMTNMASSFMYGQAPEKKATKRAKGYTPADHLHTHTHTHTHQS